MLIVGHPLCTPGLRGRKIGAVFSYRRAPADTPCHARRPPAFCRPDLPHFYAAYGRLHLMFKPSVCASNGVPPPRDMPGPGGLRGATGEAYAMQEAAGRRGKLGNRGFRTPVSEVGTSTDAPVPLTGVRGCRRLDESAPWALEVLRAQPPAHSLGTFSCARESTPPAGAGTGTYRACRHPRQTEKIEKTTAPPAPRRRCSIPYCISEHTNRVYSAGSSMGSPAMSRAC